MPPIVNVKKCNGCKGRAETFCEEICPGDLMMLNPETGKRKMAGLPLNTQHRIKIR